MYNLFLNKHNFKKVYYVIFMILVFSLLYTFFSNEDFAGWIEVSNNPYFFIDKFKIKFYVFTEYSKKYKNFITKDEFMKIPIMKLGNYLHVLNKNNKETLKDKNKKIKEIFFNIYAIDNKLSLDEFTSLPFKYDLYDIKTDKVSKLLAMSTKYSVSDYFDRLYFSIITQTTVGYGDIFPANRLLRFLTMLQALSTIFIIVI